MAKRIVDEEMRFTVVINGNEAQKELYELETRNRNLTKANKDLRAERAKLHAQGKRNTDEYKRLTAEIKKNSMEMEGNRKRMSALQKNIGLTGLTMGQLKKQASQLRLQLHNMVPGSAQYKKLEADLTAVNARINQLKVSSRGAESSLSRLASGFNKYQALAFSFIAMSAGIVLSLQKMIDFNGKLSDAQSDVMKTTGLTRKEVDELSKSFGALKTRTARIELLELATEAGRLGIEGTANIRGFVEQANKLKVALGDDLSVEQIREVGKLVNIYKVGEETGKDFAGSMDALGSAINEVAASGANQAGFLVEYLKRQAGIAAQAKISAAENIGYAATFDEIGQSVEVSATAMNKVFIDMFTNPAEYAKIAGMSVKDFSGLLKKDANEAMIQFLTGLQGNNEGLSIMVKKLEDLDAGGTRGVQALSALAGNTDLLRKRQEQANTAQAEATSLTNEYNLKNDNLAGTLDKVRKSLIGTFASEKVVNGLNSLVTWFAKFIGASEDADGSVTRFRNRLVALLKALIVVASAILSNVVYLKLIALWELRASQATWLYITAQKAKVLWSNVAMAATQLYAAATMLLTGNIKGATQAIRVMSATMKTTPWGLVLGLLSAVVTAYLVFAENAERAATAQDYINEATKESTKNIAAEKAQLETLLKIARDETASKEARQKAVNELNRIVPEYNNNLTIETANTREADKVLNKYIDTLQRQAEVEFFKQLVSKKAQEVIEAENSSLQDNIQWYETLWNGIKKGGNLYASMGADIETATKNKKDFVEATKAELEIAKELLKERLKENPDLITDPEAPSPTYTPTGGNLDAAKKAAEERRKLLEKSNKELLDATRDTQDARLELMDDAYLKELSQMQLAHKRKLEDLEKQKADEAEILGLQNKIDSALVKGSHKEAVELEVIKQAWIAKNAELNKQIEAEDEAFVYRKAAMVEKGYEGQIKELDENFKKQQIIREIAFNNELAALGADEKAKKKLKEEYAQQELDAQTAHMEEVIRQMKLIVEQNDFGGINLDLLSDEEKEEVLARIKELELALSKLGVVKSNLTGSGGDEFESAFKGEGNVDILGMDVEQWSALITNLDTTQGKIEAVVGAVIALSAAWSTYNQFVSASEQKRLREYERYNQHMQEKLRSRLDSGLINQRQYDEGVKGLQKEMEKRQAEAEYKQAKRAKEMAMANILIDTARAIIGIWADFPKADFGITATIASIAVGLLGATQFAMVAKQPLPSRGFEKGFGYGQTYPVRREQDGKIFDVEYGGMSRSGMVNKPTHFIAGEGGRNFPELIVSGPDLKQFNPAVRESIQNELARIKGFERGYTGGAIGENASTPGAQNNEMLLSMVAENTAVLRDLRDKGVIALLSRDFENVKKLQDDLDDLKRLRDKSKVNGI